MYNSASKPKVYDKYGGTKVFSDALYYGYVNYIFICVSVDFKNFPFDTQSCTMLLDLEISKHILDIKPFNDEDLYLNISVDPLFSHNEWIITRTSVNSRRY